MDKKTDEDCPSRMSWTEVLSGSAKRFVWNFFGSMGDESGRSFIRLALWIVLGLILLTVAGSLLDRGFGWFGGFFTGWFDWIPFMGDSAESTQTAPEPAVTESEPGLICSRTGSWNWFCN